ncbi:DUF1269 domain-containing protein [Paracoccus alkenifer]|uniref:Uncharacterized membrane protein n=1 Tax=Paracoccus alkenifer TaxID=65735 RepID=A0A1H6MQT4_9RHOB|nr:DUF1269 domain-containing protein [Paracoccus alkenifer]SEI04256.1 Uncharacterized membrane protein [Paracoccus alkenifer]
MSQLIVVGFDTEEDAFALRKDLGAAQKEYLLRLEDAVVVTRPSAGEYQLHQALNMTTTGALTGTFWGGLIGLLFLAPLAGAAIGAASGALAGSATDYGINDDFIREIGKTVPEGAAAVFILASNVNLDKLLPRLEQYAGARVIQTSLSDVDEARLRAALAGTGGRLTQDGPPGGAAAGAATVAGQHPVPPEIP